MGVAKAMIFSRPMMMLICAAALLGFSAPAGAADNFPDIMSLDMNHDGKVSRQEFSSSKRSGGIQRFERLDKNRDGYITKDDLRPVLQAMDADGDGKISRQEFIGVSRDKKRAAAIFKVMDVNQDGYITKDDLRYVYRSIDSDKDGKLSLKELEKWRKDFEAYRSKLEAPVNDIAPRKSDFKDLDYNRDGYADFNEFHRGWSGFLDPGWWPRP